jgi:hypothetical protein
MKPSSWRVEAARGRRRETIRTENSENMAVKKQPSGLRDAWFPCDGARAHAGPDARVRRANDKMTSIVNDLIRAGKNLCICVTELAMVAWPDYFPLLLILTFPRLCFQLASSQSVFKSCTRRTKKPECSITAPNTSRRSRNPVLGFILGCVAPLICPPYTRPRPRPALLLSTPSACSLLYHKHAPFAIKRTACLCQR